MYTYGTLHGLPTLHSLSTHHTYFHASIYQDDFVFSPRFAKRAGTAGAGAQGLCSNDGNACNASYVLLEDEMVPLVFFFSFMKKGGA